MDVEITKLNGDSFRLSEYDVVVQDFNVGSIPVTGIYGMVEGRVGTVDYGADLGQRPITVPFYINAYDMADYPLLRDELFALTVSREPFYVREMRRPSEFTKSGEDNNDRHVGGKRYNVRIVDGFELEQNRHYGFGELALETVNLPYAESIGTAQDIHQRGINADDALWGFGMGLIADDSSLIYTHTGTSFKIFNAGNVPIHPYEQELKITISNVQGSTSYLQLRNNTTGDTFRTIEAVNSNQTIILDGPNVTSNGLQYYRKTNHQFITLAPGWNEFTLTGASSARVAFDFPFYYK